MTGEPLASVVRQSLRFDELGLKSTWGEVAEFAPAGAEQRARQFFDDVYASNVHASFDMFGGGGLVIDRAIWRHLFRNEDGHTYFVTEDDWVEVARLDKSGNVWKAGK